jgi:cysteine desulfurase/selenocysteine lyase
VDGAQAFPHLAVDVQDLDCDFYVFSSHKAYGPTGVGVVYGKTQWLDAMPPYQGGGDMIETVSFTKTTYNKLPFKFEAGTPNIAGVIGFGAALNYLRELGMATVRSHEQALLAYAMDKLATIPGLRVIGTAKDKVGVISFVMDGVHPHDIGTILDDQGIAIRAGHHCAMPLMERFNVPATARMSLGIYNTEADVDALVLGLQTVQRLFN